jgi:co-chaperonin GroES (HSP10)
MPNNIIPMPKYALIRVIPSEPMHGMVQELESDREQPMRGEVIAADNNLPYQPGDIVIYARWQGVELEDGEHKLIKSDDVYGYISTEGEE